MYNRFEKGMQPRQSVTDYLMAVKEETQQLEEELEALEEVRHTCFVNLFSVLISRRARLHESLLRFSATQPFLMFSQ